MQPSQRLLRPPAVRIGDPWKTVVYHHFAKLGVVCDTRQHFILAYRVGRGPRPDVDEFRPLLAAALRTRPFVASWPTPATIPKPITCLPASSIRFAR